MGPAPSVSTWCLRARGNAMTGGLLGDATAQPLTTAAGLEAWSRPPIISRAPATICLVALFALERFCQHDLDAGDRLGHRVSNRVQCSRACLHGTFQCPMGGSRGGFLRAHADPFGGMNCAFHQTGGGVFEFTADRGRVVDHHPGTSYQRSCSVGVVLLLLACLLA